MKRLYFVVVSRKTAMAILWTVITPAAALLLWTAMSFIAGGGAVQTSAEGGAQAGNGGKLAIIIDDFGSSREGVKEMMSIDRHLTFAVMPFCEHSQEDARSANEKGYEVIVHLPMEPNQGKRSWLGPRPILAGMKGDEVLKIVRDAFDDIPFAIGANIHMGSKASSDEDIIDAVLEVIKEKDLYFVDSRTADQPISKKIADIKGVRCYERNVFIDGQQPKSFVKDRLSQAADIALKKGYAVAIGHVGVEGGVTTAGAISEMLPEFERRGIELVYISELEAKDTALAP